MNGQESTIKDFSGLGSHTRANDFGYYWNIIVLPILLVVVIKIILVMVGNILWYYYLTADIVALFLISLIVVQRVKGGLTESGTAGALYGIITGLVVALFKLIWLRKGYLFFNLLAEPIRTLILGLALGIFFAFLLQNIRRRSRFNHAKPYLSSLRKYR